MSGHGIRDAANTGLVAVSFYNSIRSGTRASIVCAVR